MSISEDSMPNRKHYSTSGHAPFTSIPTPQFTKRSPTDIVTPSETFTSILLLKKWQGSFTKNFYTLSPNLLPITRLFACHH